MKNADRTIWVDADDPTLVRCIDQRLLPFEYGELSLSNWNEMVVAIADMAVRGAGCIGVSAAYGMYLAALSTRDMSADTADAALQAAAAGLNDARPTAVNLSWAVGQQLDATLGIDDPDERVRVARRIADAIADDDIAMCAAIGQHGLDVIRQIYADTGRTVQVMTHCNAGWLAFVRHGTATAPVYAAQEAGIPVHVYVSETRPRNQGARLTAWELRASGVACTLIADNAAGHLMQRGQVDLVIVGSDRTTANGDVANKIGTYMKAVVAAENGVPFYAAVPSSTFDPRIHDGVAEIPIEERSAHEVTTTSVFLDGTQRDAPSAAPDVDASNFGFDVTPAKFVTGIITERGICEARPDAIAAMFPEFERSDG